MLANESLLLRSLLSCFFLQVDQEVLEPSSSGLQPNAIPSQLLIRAQKKARRRNTGLDDQTLISTEATTACADSKNRNAHIPSKRCIRIVVFVLRLRLIKSLDSLFVARQLEPVSKLVAEASRRSLVLQLLRRDAAATIILRFCNCR